MNRDNNRYKYIKQKSNKGKVMSLLKELIKEMASSGATGADSIANVPGSLFGGGIVDVKKAKKRQKHLLKRVMNIKPSMKRLKESLGVDLGRTDFDAADVVSRIDAAAKKAEKNEDTVPFGLEDEDGNIVKVYVRSDQADDFEKRLSALLSGEDSNEDDENSAMEIAEVLFDLKDEFDIVDVEWPQIEGDKEEEQEVVTDEEPPAGEDTMQEPEQGEEGGEVGDMTDLEGEGGEQLGEPSMSDEETAKSALDKVIDMMKADAEAKKAEAEAREAEARAKEAEYAAQAAAAKIRREEQILDMETAEKEKAEQEKEAKQLAKLAKYQYQKAQDAEVKLSMESVEDEDPWKDNDIDKEEDDDEITLQELTQLIIRNLGHNS